MARTPARASNTSLSIRKIVRAEEMLCPLDGQGALAGWPGFVSRRRKEDGVLCRIPSGIGQCQLSSAGCGEVDVALAKCRGRAYALPGINVLCRVGENP